MLINAFYPNVYSWKFSPMVLKIQFIYSNHIICFKFAFAQVTNNNEVVWGKIKIILFSTLFKLKMYVYCFADQIIFQKSVDWLGTLNKNKYLDMFNVHLVCSISSITLFLHLIKITSEFIN